MFRTLGYKGGEGKGDLRGLDGPGGPGGPGDLRRLGGPHGPGDPSGPGSPRSPRGLSGPIGLMNSEFTIQAECFVQSLTLSYPLFVMSNQL